MNKLQLIIKILITTLLISVIAATIQRFERARELETELKDTYKSIEILMNYQYQLEAIELSKLAPIPDLDTTLVSDADIVWAKNTLNVIGNNYCKECDLGIGIQPCY